MASAQAQKIVDKLLESEGRPGTSTCKYCKEGGLNWRKVQTKFGIRNKLHTAEGVPHACQQAPTRYFSQRPYRGTGTGGAAYRHLGGRTGDVEPE